RILAPPVPELDERPMREPGRLTRERGRPRENRVAVCTVAARARLGEAPPGLEVGGLRRRAGRRAEDDERDAGERQAARDAPPPPAPRARKIGRASCRGRV